MSYDNNIIQTPTGTIIINGGNPLSGCPESWDEANAWQAKANEEKDEFTEPLWNFDCGFKLDFDGPILSVNSRFYPPTTHGGATWNGSVTVTLVGKDIEEKKFDCKTLDELRAQVELYIDSLKKQLSLFKKYPPGGKS